MTDRSHRHDRSVTRVARLVLAGCETPYDAFPPPFDGLPLAAASTTSLDALRDPDVRRSPAAYGWLAKHPIDPVALDSYVLPCLASRTPRCSTTRRR
jgi:hypothetical protein